MSVSYMSMISPVFRACRLDPGRLQLRRTCCFVLCCVLGFLAAGCPATPSPTPPASRQPGDLSTFPVEERQAYARADALRTRGQFPQARQALTDFIQRFPSSPLTDDALLALGQITTALGEHRSAQETYEMLLRNFPLSEHASQARLELGISYYQSKDYDRSQAVLRQLLDPSMSPKYQAPAYYYLGMIAREQKRYDEAIAAFKRSAEISPEAELARQAQEQISLIVRDDLTLTALEHLASQYPAVYPGDLILLQLAQLYREVGNEVDEMAVLQRFTATFPEHPQAQVATERLHDLQALLTTDRTKIGVLLPLSGEGNHYGQSALHGIELALAVWQEQHPDLELSLVIRDSQNASVSASDTLHFLVNDAHVIGVIGPLFSQVATELAPLTEQLKVPLISPYAPDSHFPALSTYAFRSSLTDDFQARFLAQYALQSLNLQRFVVLYADEPYGIALKDLFIEHIIQLQGSVLAAVSYPPDATDFSESIKRLGGVDDETLRDLKAGAEPVPSSRASGAQLLPPLYDAIFIPGYYDKAGLIAPALVFYNITDVQLLGSDGWNAPEIVGIGERFVEGAIFVDAFFVASPTPLVQEFVARFEVRYHEKPDVLAAQAYDTVWMIAAALQEGAKTRPQLRDGLLHVQNFAGVSGITTIRPDGDAEKIPYVLSIRNGQIVQLPQPPF
jgi:branched-chain amino acid transport system substrate-binding protein